MAAFASHRPIVLFTNSLLMRGMEQHILQLAHGLVQRGFQVAAVCSRRDELEPLREGLRECGVRLHTPADRDPSALGTAQRVWALVETLRQYPGCILHLHFSLHSTGELATLAGRLAGARAIVRTEHNPPQPPPRRVDWVRTRLRDALLARVVYVSQQNRREYLMQLGRSPSKAEVVPNGVDLRRFSTAISGEGVCAELGFDEGAPLVGTVTSLAEDRKGVPYFLEMAAAVSRERPDVRFVVVGDGPLRRDLEAQAHGLGLSQVLRFVGQRMDIPRMLAAMAVFVLPSLYEGGPITLLEAMAMARPVVTTPVGIAADVIEDGCNGVLVDSADSTGLASGVLRILGNAALAYQLGHRAHDLIARDYSIDAMIDGVVRIYKSVA